MNLNKKQKAYLLDLLKHDLSIYALNDLDITEEEVYNIWLQVDNLKEVVK